MGGTVAETIRKEDGTLIKMARKTGAYNWMFFTREFADKNFDLAIENHVKAFLEMKEDFETGTPYKFNMSPVYGWCNETALVDYGLVVIDFQKKKIHSLQGYDSPGQYHAISLGSSLKLDNDEEKNLDYLISNNLLQVFKDDKNIGDLEEVFGKDVNIEKMRKLIRDSYTPGIKWALGKIFNKSQINDFFDIKFVPKVLLDFDIVKYEENDPLEMIRMVQNLVNDGFSFNEKEKKMWIEEIQSLDTEYIMSDEEYNCLDSDKFEAEYKNKINKFVSELNKVFNQTKKTIKP